MIPKGCTCENSFSVPFSEEEVDNLCVTYKQNKVIKFEKKLEDCIIKNGKLYIALTQEDTLKLDDYGIIKIQIKSKLKSGAVTKSNIVETYTDEVLCNEVI